MAMAHKQLQMNWAKSRGVKMKLSEAELGELFQIYKMVPSKVL